MRIGAYRNYLTGIIIPAGKSLSADMFKFPPLSDSMGNETQTLTGKSV
jgi:hypothetical protein